MFYTLAIIDCFISFILNGRGAILNKQLNYEQKLANILPSRRSSWIMTKLLTFSECFSTTKFQHCLACLFFGWGMNCLHINLRKNDGIMSWINNGSCHTFMVRTFFYRNFAPHFDCGVEIESLLTKEHWSKCSSYIRQLMNYWALIPSLCEYCFRNQNDSLFTDASKPRKYELVGLVGSFLSLTTLLTLVGDSLDGDNAHYMMRWRTITHESSLHLAVFQNAVMKYEMR